MSSEAGTMVPENVDITSGEIAAPADLRLTWQPMDRDQAIEATNRANAYAKRLPMVIKECFDGRAWEALGYESWDEYVDDALVITRRYANMLLRAAVNLELLAEAFDVDAALFGLPERVLRGMDPGTMVPAVADALAELSSEATDEERVEVIETTVRTETKKVTDESMADRLKAAEEKGRQRAMADLAAKREREAAEAAEKEAERARRADERAARKNDGAGSPTQPAPSPSGKAGADSTTDADAPGSTDADQLASGAEGGAAADPQTAAAPTLPDDWRNRLACSVHLLGCDAALLRDALTDDDRIDLTDLRDHLNDVLEQNT